MLLTRVEPLDAIGRRLPIMLPHGRFGLGARLALTFEILVSYAELLWILRRTDLPTMVARARRARFGPRELPPGASEQYVAVRMGRVVNRVIDVLPTDKRCLINSLVTVRVLSQRSVGTQVVIGVQGGDRFAAHAWVEHEGTPVLPPGDYQRLIEL